MQTESNHTEQALGTTVFTFMTAGRKGWVAPVWARFRVTADFVATLRRLRGIVQNKHLDNAAVSWPIEVGPTRGPDPDGHIRTDGERLVVASTHFTLTAKSERTCATYETTRFEFSDARRWLRDAFTLELVKAVQSMILVNTPAAAAFDARTWVAHWLEEPQPALGGKTPASFVDTAAGRALVLNLLGQIESSTYA